MVYFGCGNGKVYALDTDTGKRRWSYDTTPVVMTVPATAVDDSPGSSSLDPEQEDVFDSVNRQMDAFAQGQKEIETKGGWDELVGTPEELQDRNDLNGSVALGLTGLYIGGEHGYVCYLPYDYCLSHEGRQDERCETNPGEEFDEDVNALYYVTPGGNLKKDNPDVLSPATVITKRIVVRKDGRTIDASVCNNPIFCPDDALEITCTPEINMKWEPSADGRYIHIIPESFFTPDTVYTIHIKGKYYTGGWKLGNLVIGGSQEGTFEDTMEFRTESSTTNQIPLHVKEDESTAFIWTRLAAPIPPMLPSLNQIGFDTYNWLIGTIAISEPDEQRKGKVILWAMGAHALVNGMNTPYVFPLSGEYMNDYFIISNQKFEMPITDIGVPFNIFQLRGQMKGNYIVEPGAIAYAETEVLSIPNFGIYMALAGLANGWWEKLLAMGTYITRPYKPESPVKAANRRPPGLAVDSLEYKAPTVSSAGSVTASFQLMPSSRYSLTEHAPAILLVDKDKMEALPIDYYQNLTRIGDEEENLLKIILNIPPETPIPANVEAYVILDAFPFYQQTIGSGTLAE